MKLLRREADMIEDFARGCFPNECCGAVLELPKAGDPFFWERHVLLFTNIQNELHARDPKTYPRTAREAYAVSPDDRELLARMLAGGYRVVALFHSHPDGDARFSEFDADRARHSPLWWEHLIVAVTARGVSELAAYRWQREKGYYDRVPVQVMAAPECQPA